MLSLPTKATSQKVIRVKAPRTAELLLGALVTVVGVARSARAQSGCVLLTSRLSVIRGLFEGFVGVFE